MQNKSQFRLFLLASWNAYSFHVDLAKLFMLNFVLPDKFYLSRDIDKIPFIIKA